MGRNDSFFSAPRDVCRCFASVAGPASRTGAFTLIEMLAVISIISILMGLALVGINAARESGDESAVSSDIQFLRSSIHQFAEEWGSFPPTTLADFDKSVRTNAINAGNEALFACLITRKHGGPYAELAEDRWENADADRLSPAHLDIVKKQLDWLRGNDVLLEYVDLWRNPYVYIHHLDYGKQFSYQTADGRVFRVQAQKNPTTGTYYAPTTFQLWSLGADGENSNGGGDDIVSWR